MKILTIITFTLVLVLGFEQFVYSRQYVAPEDNFIALPKNQNNNRALDFKCVDVNSNDQRCINWETVCMVFTRYDKSGGMHISSSCNFINPPKQAHWKKRSKHE